MNKIILHIPHSSKEIPSMFWHHICQSKDVIHQFVNAITDIDTDILFTNNQYEKIVFPYSRVFCDIEKFADDKLETMNKFGMGAIYSKTNLGVCFRNHNQEYNDEVLAKYYYPYHERLNNKVDTLLKEHECVVLIDCHSFSKDIIMIPYNQKDLPEICIGFNGEKDSLSAFCMQYFQNLNYTVKGNYPYSGSMIPNSLIRQPNPKFKSIMIEINKELYTKNQETFYAVQQDINHLLQLIEHLPLSEF